jgi:uncharacterized protein
MPHWRVFDSGEVVTIPSLSDVGLWQTLQGARLELGPHLSLKHAAERYRAAEPS